MQDVGTSALQMLTVEDVAGLLKVSKATAWRRVLSGDIESVKIGRSRRVHQAAVAAYQKRLRGQNVPRAAQQGAA
jgi:excisionase family DNA binding protein